MCQIGTAQMGVFLQAVHSPPSGEWRRGSTPAFCDRPQEWEGNLQMTDEELDRLAEKLTSQKTKEKPRKKGLFSKVVVTLCILIVIAYTSICLLMQWARGMQPEPQLTISFFAFVSAELMSLAAIKRGKDKTK